MGAGIQRRLQPHRILQVTILHAFLMFSFVWCGAARAATSALFRVFAKNSWGVIVTAIAVCWGRGTSSTFATRSRSSTMFAKELRASRRFLSCSLRLRGDGFSKNHVKQRHWQVNLATASDADVDHSRSTRGTASRPGLPTNHQCRLRLRELLNGHVLERRLCTRSKQSRD